MRSVTIFVSIILLLFVLPVSCKKNIDSNANGDVPQYPDLTTKVSATASGFVTNEQDEPVFGATVKMGNKTTNTDKYGYFEIRNSQVVKEAAAVTVEYTGYFKGLKTFSVTEGKQAFFRIKLLQKTIAGSIQATAGGTVSLPNGLQISFPANAIKTAATGSMYTGTVQVAAQWIDPTSAELNKIMPGDLRGINTGGIMKSLTTFGMAAVTLIGTNGEMLQIADGKKAGIVFPLPAVMSGTAPASIPLWYFDENTGLWKEEGSATKMGNNYVGEVSHFSFWNVDVPASFVFFTANLKVENGMPVGLTPIKISVLSDPLDARWGYTDTSGFVSGFVPANTALKLEILPSNYCTGSIFSHNFTTGSTNYSAGLITVPSSTTFLATISGTATNCNNEPVDSGFVIIKLYNEYAVHRINNDGSYHFSAILCSSTGLLEITAIDVESLQQSAMESHQLVPGSNVIPDIMACGVMSNFYDGKYLMNGYHNRQTYAYPYTNVVMSMITVGTGQVAFYWDAAGSVGHPIATGPNNQLSWYGPAMAPVIKFDASHEVIDVFNSGSSTPISLYTGPIPTHNYYDTVTRKIYVAWQYNNNTDRAFFDTLTYTGPR